MLHLPVSLLRSRDFFNILGDFVFCWFLENTGASPVDVLQFCFSPCVPNLAILLLRTYTSSLLGSRITEVFFRLLLYGSRGQYLVKDVSVFLRPLVWMTHSGYDDLDRRFFQWHCSIDLGRTKEAGFIFCYFLAIFCSLVCASWVVLHMFRSNSSLRYAPQCSSGRNSLELSFPRLISDLGNYHGLNQNV